MLSALENISHKFGQIIPFVIAYCQNILKNIPFNGKMNALHFDRSYFKISPKSHRFSGKTFCGCIKSVCEWVSSSISILQQKYSGGLGRKTGNLFLRVLSLVKKCYFHWETFLETLWSLCVTKRLFINHYVEDAKHLYTGFQRSFSSKFFVSLSLNLYIDLMEASTTIIVAHFYGIAVTNIKALVTKNESAGKTLKESIKMNLEFRESGQLISIKASECLHCAGKRYY